MGVNVKKLVVLIAILTIVLLGTLYTSTSKQSSESNGSIDEVEKLEQEYSIQPSELSDETKRIIGALGQDIKVFDVMADTDLKLMTGIWLEVYEKGVRKEDLLNFRTGGVKESKKKQLILSTKMKRNEENNTSTFSYFAATADHNSTGGTEDEIILPTDPESQLVSSLSSKKVIQINQPVTLMTIIQHNESGIFYSDSGTDHYDESGDLPENLRVYDRVFFFRMMLVQDQEQSVRKIGENEILQDAKVLASNTFVGEVVGKNSTIPLTPLLIEEAEVKENREKEKMKMNITAYIGNEEWRSESKHTFHVNYELNEANQWEARGIHVQNPIIKVVSRQP